MTTTVTKSGIYLIDTSSFVVLDTLFPIASWQPVWDFLDLKIDEGKIKTIEEVEDELKKKFYSLQVTSWVKARSLKIRYPYIADHFQYLNQVVYPNCAGLINPNSTSTLYADPMLLAVGGHGHHSVVTDEVFKTISASTNPLKIRIPNHCATLGIHCIYGRYAWTELFNELGLQVTGFRT